MRIWTYVRPFRYKDTDYEAKFYFSFLTYTSQLFCNGVLIDECTHSFKSELKVIEHEFRPDNHPIKITVSVGYYNWWNIGIEVRENDVLIHSSHPGKDIHFVEKKLERLNSSSNSTNALEQSQRQSEKWQKNKHSIFADVGLGAIFYIVAKVTGDLTVAAFTGVFLGLSLVILQRFVKVDLLGGFAVFGTIMLLISAVFSLAFQSEYLVQLKGTVTGLIAASVLITDGICRKGRYFGPRFARYLSSPIEHQYFVVGLGLIGIFMAGVNYSVASQLTKDAWLTYSTFLDTPLYLIMFFILIWRAEKRYKNTFSRIE
jgi:intracellular septation protein A